MENKGCSTQQFRLLNNSLIINKAAIPQDHHMEDGHQKIINPKLVFKKIEKVNQQIFFGSEVSQLIGHHYSDIVSLMRHKGDARSMVK